MDSCYKAVLLGIYTEMCQDLVDNATIIFGVIIDLGSRAQQWKEYCGAGIRYVTKGSIITRIIGFQRTAFKTGIVLEEIIVNVVNQFNTIIRLLKNQLRHKFPVKLEPLPMLKMSNLRSFGADGA